MTIYVFDSSPLIDLFRHYYRTRSPSLWTAFDAMVTQDRITSTREVFNELNARGDDLAAWCAENRQQVFITPSVQELDFVREIFEVRHFQSMIRRKARLQGSLVADPFVIARATCLENGCVVTTEKYSPNAAKIPNVCEHFGVDCINLEEFMEREQWRF